MIGGDEVSRRRIAWSVERIAQRGWEKRRGWEGDKNIGASRAAYLLFLAIQGAKFG
jgi:hypothetical protein